MNYKNGNISVKENIFITENEENSIIKDPEIFNNFLIELNSIKNCYLIKNYQSLHDSLHNLHMIIFSYFIPYHDIIISSNLIDICFSILKEKDLFKLYYYCLLILSDLTCGSIKYSELIIESDFIPLSIQLNKRIIPKYSYLFRNATICILTNLFIEPNFRYLFEKYPFEMLINCIYISQDKNDLKYPLKFISILTSTNYYINYLDLIHNALDYSFQVANEFTSEYIFRILWNLSLNNCFDFQNRVYEVFIDFLQNQFSNHLIFSLGFLEIFTKNYSSFFEKLNIKIDDLIKYIDLEDQELTNSTLNVICSYINAKNDYSNHSSVLELIDLFLNNYYKLSFGIKSNILKFLTLSLKFMSNSNFQKLNYLNYLEIIYESILENSSILLINNILEALNHCELFRSHQINNLIENEKISLILNLIINLNYLIDKFNLLKKYL